MSILDNVEESALSVLRYLKKDKFKFNILGTEYKTAVSHFHVSESISKPYSITLDLASKNQIKLDSIIKKEAVLTIAGLYEDRYFHGYISNFMMTGRVDTFFSYHATVVPYVWFMDLNQNFRIFQNMTVEEIVKKLLDKNRIAVDEYEFSLKNKYKTRRYCTQYGESDFQFMCRILEEEGIFYFFEHTEESHIMVFSDTEDIYAPIAGESAMDFNTDSNMVAEKETIGLFTYNTAIRPGTITHMNYNFKDASMDLKVTEEGESHTEHVIYEYPGAYSLPDDGAPKVQTHLSAAKALERSAHGQSNCSRFMPGCTFSISSHPYADLNGEFCLVSVEHEGSQTGVYGENSGIGVDYTYFNTFLAIPAATIYRPGKTYLKPYVQGIQTAVVTGEEGSEIYTDAWGRIKVKFHWDYDGESNDASSCWLRSSQPWSGNGWGFVSLPRVGDEVLVAFVNGDPDWPIMLGNVNNSSSPALYDLPDNKTQSGIKTRSTPGGGTDNFNELRFEDKKGSEEVYLQAEKDWNILVKNNRGQTISGNNTTTISGDNTATISGGSTINITKTLSETAEEITLTANTKITLVCGGSTIVLDSSGITIKGTQISLNQ